MTATYTFDVFSSLDGYGSYAPPGDWGGYWGKQGPEFLDHRLATYDGEQRMLLGATTFRQFVDMIGALGLDADEFDDSVRRMRTLPTTVISSTLEGPVDWPDATIAPGNAAEVVRRMKAESDIAIRSNGSLSLNWALLAAGLVDLVQVTVFPVIAGRTGDAPVFGGAGDFDLDLVSTRTFDDRITELVYRPTAHPRVGTG